MAGRERAACQYTRRAQMELTVGADIGDPPAGEQRDAIGLAHGLKLALTMIAVRPAVRR